MMQVMHNEISSKKLLLLIKFCAFFKQFKKLPSLLLIRLFHLNILLITESKVYTACISRLEGGIHDKQFEIGFFLICIANIFFFNLGIT